MSGNPNQTVEEVNKRLVLLEKALNECIQMYKEDTGMSPTVEVDEIVTTQIGSGRRTRITRLLVSQTL